MIQGEINCGAQFDDGLAMLQNQHQQQHLLKSKVTSPLGTGKYSKDLKNDVNMSNKLPQQPLTTTNTRSFHKKYNKPPPLPKHQFASEFLTLQ
uniref:Uncharacterized protein n=1 Tax=Meloidogyne enterolobii TaxID=390850 RepID=A0A6V7UWH6_MELEN|nr:unnamed protein product [Meloidogyne enterolobii]